MRQQIIRIVVLFFLGTGIFPTVFAQDYWGQHSIKSPENFIFGYGSLISSKSRNASVATPIPAIPVRVSSNLGYIRSWNSRSPTEFTALGLRKPNRDEKATSINGVLYPVAGNDMASYDQREEGYVRVGIPLTDIEALSWQGLPKTGKIWVYVPAVAGNEPGVGLPGADSKFPLLQSYIDVVLEGAMEYGDDFVNELISTTKDWDPHWLNDRILPRRPWVAEKQYGKIDNYLKQVPSLQNRQMPEDYAASLAVERLQQKAN